MCIFNLDTVFLLTNKKELDKKKIAAEMGLGNDDRMLSESLSHLRPPTIVIVATKWNQSPYKIVTKETIWPAGYSNLSNKRAALLIDF